MTGNNRPPRPKVLLDAIESENALRFDGIVWRVVTEGFDPLRPGRAGGRWDDGSFDVLYTSSERDGALAEAWFHVARGQPLIPSKNKKRLFQLRVELNKVLDLSVDGKLTSLGVNMSIYGRLSYVQRTEEYPTLQQIGEVAFFYEYEAIVVPNARWPTSNVIILTENVNRDQLTIVESDPVDLETWYQKKDGGQL